MIKTRLLASNEDSEVSSLAATGFLTATVRFEFGNFGHLGLFRPVLSEVEGIWDFVLRISSSNLQIWNTLSIICWRERIPASLKKLKTLKPLDSYTIITVSSITTSDGNQWRTFGS